MPPFNIFKKRKQQAEQAGKSVVYKYDSLPREFRVQVVHLFTEISEPFPFAGNPFWGIVRRSMVKEIGKFDLAGNQDPFRDCEQFMQEERDSDLVLSLIEIVFVLAHSRGNDYVDHRDLEAASDELNHRFREHQLGYQYHSGQIVQMDSDYLHSEAVEPALSLLAARGFKGASEEFLKAHRHYREGNYREAIGQALNAFESTMKVICDERRLTYGHKDTASKLIEKLFDDDFIPPELQSEFTSLQSVLACGVPTVRNRKSGHGQGAKVVAVPGYLAAYALHMTASNIVFLVEAHRAGGK